MKKILLIAFLCLFFVSCDIYKKSNKTKTDKDFTEQIKTKTYRKGDTVVYVPNIQYKDTTIYTYNRQGTTLKTVYNKSGQLAKVDCYTSAIEEMKEENRKLLEQIKNKDSEKKEEVNTTWILYLVGGLVLVCFFALFLMFIYINKNTKIITNLIPKIS